MRSGVPLRSVIKILDIVLSSTMLQWLSHSQLLLGQWLPAMDYLIRHVSSFKLEKSSLLILTYSSSLNLNIGVKDHHDDIMAFRNLR